MASISRLMPSFANGSLEIAPALANINFDFSLFKVDAPKEYKGVGDVLSTMRRENAESGMSHITARRLGALFGHLLPSTPSLFSAYGRRASEISESSAIDSGGRQSYGVFASQVGADATSLWAAATSGQGAIAVHLLACMLARMWDGPQATSIWMEIIEKRQVEILRQFEETNIGDIGALSAAKQSIAREQIREWDASARAWLRAADTVKKVQQKQLSLIIDNIKLPVNGKTDTYESVIEAWKNSLEQMDGLVNGISQNARHGDILLALSAWHLFPDMMVVVPTTVQVRQQDPIFSLGGMLTLGLETPDSVGRSGVYWSLPLARLRHYGTPVTSVQSIDSRERSRVQLDEFLQITLGCYLQSWGEVGKDTVKILRWFRDLFCMIEAAAQNGRSLARTILDAQGSWFNLMLVAGKYYTECSDTDRTMAAKLILLGRKHGSNFLGLAPRPMFGLPDTGKFVGSLKVEEERIKYLRRIAKIVADKLNLSWNMIFIRYVHDFSSCGERTFEYATAIPSQRKRKQEESGATHRGHRRWLYGGGEPRQLGDIALPDKSTIKAYPVNTRVGPFGRIPAGSRSTIRTTETIREIAQAYDDRNRQLSSNGEAVSRTEDELLDDSNVTDYGVYWKFQREATDPGIWFKYLWGDINSAALFVPGDFQNLVRVARDPIVDSQDFLSFFEEGALCGESVVGQLNEDFCRLRMQCDPHLLSLKALSTAAELYTSLPRASVDIRVFKQKLYAVPWLPKTESSIDQTFPISTNLTIEALKPYVLDRASAFACLTMFETGIYDPSPDMLQDVMAMSSADSLYVSATLMCDPSEVKAPGAIKHILGNIGRPGITFLVPPIDPMIKKAQMSDWPVINHQTFTGDMKDNFGNTTLHLSFTSAKSEINLGFSGAQDTELSLLQTLISVHDRGKWVADLDIFKSLTSTYFLQLPPCSDELHSTAQPPRYRMTSIDDWLELLDPPDPSESPKFVTPGVSGEQSLWRVMPAMLDDPLAPVIYRVSGEPPYPTPGHNEIPSSIYPRQVTLRDRVTITTLIPFSSAIQVPPNLMSYLSDQLNREIEIGDTYPMITPMSVSAFGAYWFQNFGAIMVLGEVESTQQLLQMEHNGVDWSKQCLGSFYIKPNYPGRSSHICNGGFLVTDAARNKGVGRLMGECYLDWAPKLNYTYSVFNLVYETNVVSCRIWDALGFKRIGRVKDCGALRSYPDHLVDAIIYGRDLGPEGEDFVPEERFDKIRYYLKTGEYPAGSDKHEKSRLRSAGSHYRLLPPAQEGGEEVLMLKDKEVISDPQQQYEIARGIHVTSHSGINKTTATIAERYHWVRIKETVSLVIKNCPDCKDSNKVPTVRPDSTSTSTPISRKPIIASANAIASHDPNQEIERLASFEQSTSKSSNAPPLTTVSSSSDGAARKAKRRSPTRDGDDQNDEPRRPAPHQPQLQPQPQHKSQPQPQSTPYQQAPSGYMRMQARDYDDMPLDPAIVGTGGLAYGMEAQGQHTSEGLMHSVPDPRVGEGLGGSSVGEVDGMVDDGEGEDEQLQREFMDDAFRR